MKTPASYTFLYARKSTEEDDRQTMSLDAQERECRTFALRQNLEIDETIREAHSARKPGRPLFNAMIATAERLLRRGTRVRVLCHKPDRLLRNLADYARLNDLLDQGIELVFVTGSYQNNAQGKMAFGINVVFAKYYVDNLSEEIRKGLTEKISRGEWPNQVPVGYRKIDKKVHVDHATAPLVRRAFEHYATGNYSLDTLRFKLHEEGLSGRYRSRPFSKSQLADHILTNPFYCGILRYRGELHQGNHEPLVPVELFERVQRHLKRHSRPQRKSWRFRFGSLMACRHCGCSITGDRKKQLYTYYRCTHRRGGCQQGYISEPRLESLVRSSVEPYLSLPHWAIRALTQAAEALSAQPELTAVSTLQEKKTALSKQLHLLVDLRLTEAIDPAVFREKQNELTMELKKTEDVLNAALLENTKSIPALVAKYIETCTSLKTILDEGNDDDVRTLLRLVGSNYTYADGKISFEPAELFTLVPRTQDCPSWWSAADAVRTITASEIAPHLPDRSVEPRLANRADWTESQVARG